ncbi:MAG: amino acid permease, partial [Hyphomicrobiales bacterium]|nr:amino acid permease [Hyphomicrobiales bacterium]
GFSSKLLGLAVGLMVAGAGLVSSAAIALGAAGYIRMLVDLPGWLVVSLLVISLTAIAAWGIVESVTVAGIMTVVEILGLVVVAGGVVVASPEILVGLPEVVSLKGGPGVEAILIGAVIAFFAFIGFEDMDNVIEEVENPARVMPRAIGITLLVSLILYLFVATVAVLALSPDELASTEAPIALLAAKGIGFGAPVVALIAIIATVNGIMVQIVMASRVLYGLAARDLLPKFLADVNPVTQTPLTATILIGAATLVLALGFPIGMLAEWTSQIILAIFVFVNLALIRIKLTKIATNPPAITLPLIVPVLGATTAAGLLVVSLIG